MELAQGRRKTYRGRGFRLLGGTMCLVIVAVIAICTAISLSIISSSTRQTNEALESAITAYDYYLQGLGGETSRTQDLLKALDPDGLLADMAGKTAVSADDAQELSRRIASYEADAHATDDQVRLYVYLPGTGRMLGSLSDGTDPRDSSDSASYDPRLSQIEDSLLATDAEDASFMAELDGTTWHVEVCTLAQGVRYVMFLSMPELPSTEILTPISDVCEMYFADRYGHKFSYSENPRFADAFEFDDLTGQGSSGFVTVERDGAKYRCYYEDNSAGYNKFVLVTLDVVAAAQHDFAGSILLASILLVLGGCLVAFLLTRHVYEPLQHIIDRLTPPGHKVHDEFRLIGLALDGMERSIAEQREVIADYGLARLLRDPSEGSLALAAQAKAESGDDIPFYLLNGASCALAAVRVDRVFGTGADAGSQASQPGASAEQVRPAVEDYLAQKVVNHALCAEGALLFAVLDARDLDVRELSEGLLRHLAGEGVLASVFTSSVYSGPSMLNAAYREAMRVMDRAVADRAFNQALGPDSLPAGDERSHPTLGTLGLFEDMCAYIQGNYRDPALSAGQLAKRFGMSQASITRLFKQRTNGTFLDYVHNLRIQEAQSLLASTAMSVADVAQRVGYGDASTMTRAFKRYRGKTPGECRGAGQD